MQRLQGLHTSPGFVPATSQITFVHGYTMASLSAPVAPPLASGAGTSVTMSLALASSYVEVTAGCPARLITICVAPATAPMG